MQTFAFPLASFANNYFSCENETLKRTRVYLYDCSARKLTAFAHSSITCPHIVSHVSGILVFLLIGFVIYYLWHENSRLTGPAVAVAVAMKVYDNALGHAPFPYHRPQAGR